MNDLFYLKFQTYNYQTLHKAGTICIFLSFNGFRNVCTFIMNIFACEWECVRSSVFFVMKVCEFTDQLTTFYFCPSTQLLAFVFRWKLDFSSVVVFSATHTTKIKKKHEKRPIIVKKQCNKCINLFTLIPYWKVKLEIKSELLNCATKIIFGRTCFWSVWQVEWQLARALLQKSSSNLEFLSSMPTLSLERFSTTKCHLIVYFNLSRKVMFRIRESCNGHVWKVDH